MTASIEANQLTKYYGRRLAVEDLTFEAHEGEILGFLGPNGAGKTTTIKLLTGYFPPTSGMARVGGYDVVRQPREMREIVGYLPENAPLYPAMSVERFLAFMLGLKRPELNRADRDTEIERVLSAVDLTARRGQLIRSLSKGLRQRTGLAQALLGDPRVIILDEATAGLDPEQVQAVRRLIAREADKGKTILLSTHILSEVEALASRVAIINRGRLVQFGTLAEVRRGESSHLRLRFQCGEAEENRIRALLAESLDGDSGADLRSLMRDGNVWMGRVAWQGEKSPAGELARCVTGHGWNLLEMTVEEGNLEAAFLDSVTGDRRNR